MRQNAIPHAGGYTAGVGNEEMKSAPVVLIIAIMVESWRPLEK